MRMAMKTLWWNWKKSVHKINMVISFVLDGDHLLDGSYAGSPVF